MNQRDPTVRPEEMVASALQSFGGQKVATETYVRARELRKWIAENPGQKSTAMPAHLRSYLSFLCEKRLVTWRGTQRLYFVVPL